MRVSDSHGIRDRNVRDHRRRRQHRIASSAACRSNAQVGGVTVIDKDVYEASNLLTQDITPRDVGRLKARVQARRLRRVNAALRVTAIADAWNAYR